MTEPRRPPPAVWSPAQRGVVVALVLALCLVLLVRSCRHPAYISDPQPIVPARVDELADRLDPNTATWQELAVLPQLGEKRARELVAYREDYLSRGHDSIAFSRAEDLLRIKGIGAAMLETLRPYLRFPTTRPSTPTKSATTTPTMPTATTKTNPTLSTPSSPSI